MLDYLGEILCRLNVCLQFYSYFTDLHQTQNNTTRVTHVTRLAFAKLVFFKNHCRLLHITTMKIFIFYFALIPVRESFTKQNYPHILGSVHTNISSFL